MDPQNAIGKEFDKYARSYDEAVNTAIAFSGIDVDFFTRAPRRTTFLLASHAIVGPEPQLSKRWMSDAASAIITLCSHRTSPA